METEIKVAKYLLTYKERKMIDGLSIESHCHAQYEMIAVFEGEVSIVSNGNQCHLSAGDVIIIPPLVYHTVKANGDVDYRRVTLLFDLCAVPPVLRERWLAICRSPIKKDVSRIFCKTKSPFFLCFQYITQKSQLK